MRKEKKRPRVTLSDGESDEDLGSHQSRKGSGEQKRKRLASPEVEKEKIVGRKKNGRGAGSGRRPAGDRRGRKLSFVDPYEFSDDVEVDMRKTMTRTLKCHRKRTREDGNERKRNRVDSYALREDAAVERNNVNVEDWKDGEENDDSKGVRALSSRHLGSMTGQRDAETECSRSSNSLLELERNQGVGWFDKKVFRLDKVNSFRLAGMSSEKPSVSTDKAIRLQGKGGVLKVLPKAKMKVEGIERTPNGRATEDGRRRLGSSTVPNQKVVTSPPVSGGKNLLEKSPLTMSKNSKTEKRKAREMEKESPGVCSRMESRNTHGNSVQKSELKSEVDSSSRLEGTPSSGYKERDDSPHTEKQLLRAEIRNMLVSAGWSIDYRPRRTKNYQDAVYVSPTGTTYWSIVNAYYAFQEEVNTGTDNSGRNPLFSPLSEEVLSLLTRKRTRKVSGKLDKKFGKLKFVAQEGKLPKPRKGSAKALKSKKDGEGSLDVLNETLEPSFEPDVHYPQGKKGKKHVRCALLVRSSNKGARESNGEGVLHARKQTVLSWLVDSGTVSVNSKVQYMNRRHTRALLDGWVTRDGIHCSCCSKIVTASKFEIHAGSKLRQPFQNIILETGTSLLQCQLDAWDKQVESKRSGFHFVDTDGDDPDDDTCGICGDGGDLICCDGCPSTFHQHCLNLQKLPPGDWHCYGCTCKFCGSVESSTSQGDGTTISPLLTCRQCEQKYHQDLTCIQEIDAAPFDSRNLYTSFCGHSCRKLFRRLHKLLGVKNDLEGEFSWTLIRRFGEKSATSSHALSKKADCNSKLAVALAVMDECFLPIIDRRSGINLIHNVLYSCGSNFNRLNYSGFYTVVLERDDEIISAACIRIHGTKLAEMPLIGTRHIYRRQGMCRRLLTAIELALCSLNVEKLIIPAISELMHTWTDVFGFKPLEESHRHEIRYMNMMVFPGADLLQKQLRKRDFVEGKTATDADAVVSATESSHHDAPDDTSLVDSSVGPHLNDSDINEEQETVNAADPCEASGGSKPEVMVESLDAPDGSDFQASGDGTVCYTSQLQDLSSEGASDEVLFHHADISNHDKTEMKNKFLVASIEKSFQSSGEGEQGQDNKVSVEVCGTENADINEEQETVNAAEPCEASGGSKSEVMIESLDAPDGTDFQASGEGTVCNTSQLQDLSSGGSSDAVLFHHADISNHNKTEMKNKFLVASPIEQSFQSSGEGDQGQDNKVSDEACGTENADINEEQETVNAAEPCEPSGGSKPKVMDESLDASDGSDFQASGEGTVCNTSQLQDQPSGGASDEVFFHHVDVPKHDKTEMKNKCLVASTVEQSFQSSGEGEQGQDNKVSVEVCGIENADINEEQEAVNAAKPCEPSGGSNPEVMDESLDASDGSDFQASGEGTICNTSQLQDQPSGGACEPSGGSNPEVMDESLDASDGSDFQASGEGNVCNTSQLQDQPSGGASDEVLFHHADAPKHDKIEMKNKCLMASPVVQCFQSSGEGEQGQENKASVEVCGTENADINEEQETVNAAEPSEASSGSKPVVMVESLDVPDGSDFQASSKGTVCNTSQLQDLSSEGASDEVLFHHADVPNHDKHEMKNECLVASHVVQSFQSSGEGEQGQDNKVSVEVCGTENADINKELETVNTAEPCEASGGSKPEVMIESLDAPDGSDFQASGEGTVCNTSQLLDWPSEGASDEVLFHHADVPNHDKTEMKNECLVASPVVQSFQSSGEGEQGQDNKLSVEACGTEIRTLVASSMDPCLNDSDVNEVQDTLIAAEDSNQACGGSIAEVMLEHLDAPDVSGFCTPGKENVCNNSVLREKSSECASKEVFVFHADESHHGETERGNQSLVASLVEPSIQSPGECGPAYTHGYQVPVEVCNNENTSLVASFVGPCLDSSDKNEIQETVSVAEASKQACTGSDAEVMHVSLDVPDGSGFQTSGEGTVCNYSDLQDKSIVCTSEKVPLHCADESRHDEAEAGNQSLSFQSSGECEPGSTHDSQVSVEVCSMEHTSLVTSSLGPCLDDSDKNEVQETVPVAEPSNQACTGSHTEVMHGSLDVPDGSGFQISGEGTVCNFTDLQVQSIEYTSEKEFLHHADESHHDKPEAGNQSLSLQSSGDHELSSIHVSQNRSAVSSFVGPHLDDSVTNELQETVPVAEPNSHVCSGSNAEVMHDSLDVPDGFGFETSGEGALCDNVNLQDKSDKCISEEVFLHQAEHHYKAEVENQSPVASPIRLSLQSSGQYELSMHDNCQACVEIHANDHKCASDIKEVKDIKSCEGSTAGVVLESLDVPDGCSVQPCEGTVSNNSKPQDKSIECASQKVFLHHSDVSHHNKVEMENQSPMAPAEPSLQFCLSRVVCTHETHHVCVEVRGTENMSPVASTVEPHLCDSDRYEVQETVAAAEPCPQACGGSIDEMMVESFDVPDGSGFPTSCEGTAYDKSGQQDQFSECASGKVFLHGPDVSLHGKTEIENQSPVVYHIESGLQSSSECELGNTHDNDLSVEADNVGNTPVASSIGPSCNDSDIQEVQEAVTGAERSNRASGGSNVEVMPASLDVPDRSGFQTLQEAVTGAEPSNRACGGSNAEVMPDSLDVSDGSGFQTSDEVTICKGLEPHDKSGECASEKESLCHDETMMENQSLVASTDELNVQSSVGFELGVQENHEDCSTENTSLLPSLGPHPHGSDGNEVEQTGASSEPINDVCEGSTVDVVLEPLNVPYGSNFQTSGEGTECDNSKTQDKSSECASEKVFIHHADASGHDKTEKENPSPAVSPVQPSAQSSGPHVINSDIKELEDSVTAAEPGNQACCGSNAEVTPDSLDVPDGSGFQTSGLSVCNISELQDKSNGCASEKDVLHHADASHYDKMESESPGAAAVEPSLQSSGACELDNARDDQICVEVCSIEKTSPVASSVGLQLHNSDMHEGIDGAVEPSSNACDGSTADVLETLDAPHGSCFQTPQGFVCNNSEPLVESSECSSEKAFIDHSDISDHDKTKVENQFHIASPVEPNLQSFVDAGLHSTHDEQVIVDDCSVESNAHTFVEATGGCSADEPRISASGASSVLSVVTDPERTEILIISTNLNRNLQETGEDKVDAIYEVKVTPIELDACNLDEGSVPSTSDVTTELPVSASGYNFQVSCDNKVHHELEIIAQPPCNAFDNQPSGECSVQLELVSKSPLNHSGTVLVLPSDTVHHNAQEVTDKSLLSSGDEPNLDSSSEGMHCSTHEVNADMTLSECNSHASGEGYVPSNSEAASTSLNAAGESEHRSFDECKSSEAVYKSCDSSHMSSPDPNMDCCKIIEDGKETNADCPVVSTPYAAGEKGTVPDTKGVESVEANHHSSVEVSAPSMPNVTNEPKDAASCISFQVTDIANPCDSGLLCKSSGSSLGAVQHDLPMTNKSAPTSPV